MKSLTSIGSHYKAGIIWKVAGEAIGCCLEISLVPSQVNKRHHFARPGDVLCAGVRPEKAVIQDFSFGAQLQDRQHALEVYMDHRSMYWITCEAHGDMQVAECTQRLCCPIAELLPDICSCLCMNTCDIA